MLYNNAKTITLPSMPIKTESISLLSLSLNCIICLKIKEDDEGNLNKRMSWMRICGCSWMKMKKEGVAILAQHLLSLCYHFQMMLLSK